MKQRVEQHRAVTGGKEEAITVFPFGILGVMAKKASPQHISHRRRAKRQAGMSGLSLLHCVERKRTNGINAKLIEFSVNRGFSFLYGRAHAALYLYFGIQLISLRELPASHSNRRVVQLDRNC